MIFFRLVSIVGVIALNCSLAAAQGCQGENILLNKPPEYLVELDQAASVFPFSSGRFFEVSKGEAKSILFGTIHLPDPDVSSIPPRLEMEIRRARSVFIEITRLEEIRMQRTLMLEPARTRNKEGRRISDFASRAEMDALALALANHGLTRSAFDKLEPWFLNMMLALPKCPAKRQSKDEKILDRAIEATAERAGIPVFGLEDAGDILAVLSSGTYEEQVDNLIMGLPLLENAADTLEVTKQLYLNGEISKIWEFSRMEAEQYFEPATVVPVFESAYKQLVTLRNETWLELLAEEFETGGVVVAVGALHLGGKSGLLSRLEDEGYTIRRILE